MRRRNDSLAEAIGTDAFLDIVANLVGILLILLMVIGVRMEDATKTAQTVTPEPPVAKQAPAEVTSPETVTPIPDPEPVAPLAAIKPVELEPVEVPDPTQAKLELERLKQSILEVNDEGQKLASAMQIQKMDRDNLMVAVTRAEKILEERREALSDVQRHKLDADLERQQAKQEFTELSQQIESLNFAAKESESEVLQHISTPLAKTVFVREEHFRLKGGRLLYVPLNEMTNELRVEAPKKMWKLKNTRQTTESIGPYDGFEMRYTLRRNRVPLRTDSGVTAVREMVELDRFVMVPVGAARGETPEQALEPTSAFSSRLSSWNPRETVITIWTYPDSFAEFRQIKADLYKLGYLTAARPLPADQLISGSPQGTRSAAQ